MPKEAVTVALSHTLATDGAFHALESRVRRPANSCSSVRAGSATHSPLRPGKRWVGPMFRQLNTDGAACVTELLSRPEAGPDPLTEKWGCERGKSRPGQQSCRGAALRAVVTAACSSTAPSGAARSWAPTAISSICSELSRR